MGQPESTGGDLIAFHKVSRRREARARIDVTDVATQIAADLKSADAERNREVTVEPGPHDSGDPACAAGRLLANLTRTLEFTGRRQPPRSQVG